MIELITTARSLAWMRKVHRPTETNYYPIQLSETRAPDGTACIPEPYGLCVRDGVACVQRGKIRGRDPLIATTDMTAWAVRTFFATDGLQPVKTIPLAEFQRLVRDAPKPCITFCEHCAGTGQEPDAKIEDDLIPVCSVCNGEPKNVDETPAFVEVGPVKVVLAYLGPFARYLGGTNVSVGIAPIAGNGGNYLHFRALTGPDNKDGDWRVVMTTVADTGGSK